MKQLVTVYGPGGYDPDLPNGNVVESYEVDVPDPQPTVEDALRIAARMSAEARIKAADLPDADVAVLSLLYDPWAVGQAVSVGDLRAWDGTIVECVQAHTTQADWTPDVVPTLWKVHRTPPASGPEQWQPNISVAVGEELEHEGVLYRVLQAHTTQVGWEPPNVPALWAVV